MDVRLTPTRRTVLLGTAGAAGLAALAACSSSGGTTAAGASTSSGAASTSGSASTDSTAAAPASDSAAGAPSSGSGGTTLVSLDSIKVGEAVSVKLPDGKPGIVARPTDTTAVAFSAICTHMGCTVAPAGQELDCPCHGSVYNATTGAVIKGPAPKPLPAVAVHVSGGQVVTGSA